MYRRGAELGERASMLKFRGFIFREVVSTDPAIKQNKQYAEAAKWFKRAGDLREVQRAFEKSGPIGAVSRTSLVAALLLSFSNAHRNYRPGREIVFAEVISVNPIWCTAKATARAKTRTKAIAVIVLGFRSAHSLGFIHGHLSREFAARPSIELCSRVLIKLS